MDRNPSSEGLASALKRKRSPSDDAPGLRSSSKRIHPNPAVNYLARQDPEDLPLVSPDDHLAGMLETLTRYTHVVERNESIASSLGVNSLSHTVIRRFERLFDGLPKVVRSFAIREDGRLPLITWLDVVEFAENQPDQFLLADTGEGKVCQFHTKQCLVQISEDDHRLISSGLPQKMIPPQPILEDEEEELGTLEILDQRIAQISQLAERVAASARQLNNRLRTRKQAIADRRLSSVVPASAGASATAGAGPGGVGTTRAPSPSNVALMNGIFIDRRPSQSPPRSLSSSEQPATALSGDVRRASQDTIRKLLAKFDAVSRLRLARGFCPSCDSRVNVYPPTVALVPDSPVPVPQVLRHRRALSSVSEQSASAFLLSPSVPKTPTIGTQSIPLPSTPNTIIPAGRLQTLAEKGDGGQFKAEMVNRLDLLAKGDVIYPPCDRCRRLRMECLKNLTACIGCTKKHAKCSWKEVRGEELLGPPISAAVSEPPDRSDDVEMMDTSMTGTNPDFSASVSASAPTSATTAVRPTAWPTTAVSAVTVYAAESSERDRPTSEAHVPFLRLRQPLLPPPPPSSTSTAGAAQSPFDSPSTAKAQAQAGAADVASTSTSTSTSNSTPATATAGASAARTEEQ